MCSLVEKYNARDQKSYIIILSIIGIEMGSGASFIRVWLRGPQLGEISYTPC